MTRVRPLITGWIIVGLMIGGLTMAGTASADVFVFGPNSVNGGQQIAALSGIGASSPQSEVAVAGNAIAIDIAANRLYFAEPAGTGSRINQLSYGASSAWNTLLDLPTFRITHLAFDPAPTPRLLVAARRTADGVTVVFPVVLSTLMPGAGFELSDDPSLGASVFRNADGRWYFTAGNTPQQLVAVQMNSGAVSRWDVPGGFRIGALVLESTTQGLWAIVDDEVAGGARVAELNPAASLSIDPRGTADPDCCFVLTGPATINRSDQRLYAITRGRGPVLPIRPVVVSFGLTDGSRIDEAEFSGNGLFADTDVVFAELFRDGFE